jgi:glycerol-3-phosphate dehydrogenase (NAD(P)+)
MLPDKESTQISVLAMGNWGTALANYLSHRGYHVTGWSNIERIVESINNNHSNPDCFSSVKLHKNFKATSDLEKCLGADVVVIAFPSGAMGEIVPQFSGYKPKIIISALKGLEGNSLLTPLGFLSKYSHANTSLVVLSGPSFAVDLINFRPIGIVAGSLNEEAAWKTAEIFTGDTLKVYISTDPLGVELGGIVKNAIALAVGVCDGLGYGDSARAGLITRGLAEMRRLVVAMGGDAHTLSGLSGLGDLVMTSSSDTSRNRTVGLRLAKGESLDKITATLGSVAEGVIASPLILKLAAKHNVDMPITTQVCKFLRGETSVADAAKDLLSRPSKREF